MSHAAHTIHDAAVQLRSGAVTAIQLAEASLAAIEGRQHDTNAFIHVDAGGARAMAAAADAELHRGVDRGPLHGIPISVKDLIDIAGQPTTAASKVLAHSIAPADAPVVARIRHAGAVIIGKTNLHEFALGTTSEDSAYGPVHNPLDLTRSAGGSSGGSAAAIVAGMGFASIGSDTGGSIRIPAAACGVVGLKPSWNEVPTDGVVPLSVTFDHIGPLARSVQDAAWLWEILSGRVPSMLAPAEPAGVRLAVLRGYFAAMTSPEVQEAFDRALGTLRAAGVVAGTAEIAGAAATGDTYVNIALPEAALWHDAYLETQPKDYTPSVRARLESGRGIPAVKYLEARRTRETLTRAVDAALAGCHALALPTLPIVAPPLGANDVPIDDARGTLPVRSAMLRHTQLFNVTGHPAISLPVPANGLPVGLQLVGHRGATADLLAIAAAVERALRARTD